MQPVVRIMHCRRYGNSDPTKTGMPRHLWFMECPFSAVRAWLKYYTKPPLLIIGVLLCKYLEA